MKPHRFDPISFVLAALAIAAGVAVAGEMFATASSAIAALIVAVAAMLAAALLRPSSRPADEPAVPAIDDDATVRW